MEEGNASSLDVGTMNNDLQAQAFYPAGMTALVASASGAEIPVAVTAMSLTMAALVWPGAIVLFTRVAVGAGTVVSLAAGVLSAGFVAFP